MALTLEQVEKLEQLQAQSDANGGRVKGSSSNFILYGLYRTAVMDAAPELIRLARERLEGRGEAEGMDKAALNCDELRRQAQRSHEKGLGQGLMDELVVKRNTAKLCADRIRSERNGVYGKRTVEEPAGTA